MFNLTKSKKWNGVLQAGLFLLVFTIPFKAESAWNLVCSDSLSPLPLNNKGEVQDCANGTAPVWVESNIFDVLTLDQDAISAIMGGVMAFYVAGLFVGVCMRLFKTHVGR
jgi:hypothetical protein